MQSQLKKDSCGTMERERAVNWSELPTEILSMIGNSLDPPVDFLRFRSICNSWRSSITRFHPICLPSPLKFPCPFGTGQDAFLSETTIYRIKPPPSNDDHNSNLSKSCLVKFDETEPGNHPYWIRQIIINNSNNNVPQILSMLDFPIVKIGKSNRLNYLNFSSSIIGVSKVIRYPDNTSLAYSEDCSIFIIYDGGKLGFAKYGDQSPTLVDDRITDYNDLIVYKGQLYVVDKCGTVWWIQFPSLKLTQFSPPLLGSGDRKHLVESCGELYVVDRYLDNNQSQGQDPNHHRRITIHRRRQGPLLRRINTEIRGDLAWGKTVDFKVYKLDETWGKWVEVTDLGDQAFILGGDISFSVSVSDFDACKGNCIYFKDRYDCSLFSFDQDGCVFNLVDRSIDKYRWSWPLCFSNLHLNRKLWILDCSNPPIIEPVTSMESVSATCQLPS
ncbi:F-box protein At2g26160-like [Ziziphus jujuba]|uniref:F-box protein At2g26160-like n=1 Tax=Ziziphus jujuba TaxID=326968 RepID=A0A6P4A3R6_ZIZJJ|nr:F-box protein At2g26160-like [Ziziphus jujuba]